MLASDPLVIAFGRVRMAPGTASKRFVQTLLAWPKERELSPRAEAYLWRIAFHYRRQLPKSVAEESVSRKVNHKWVNIGGDKVLPECSSCKRRVYRGSGREINAPCPGPPQPKTPPKRSAGEQGAVPSAKSPDEAPTLFEGR